MTKDKILPVPMTVEQIKKVSLDAIKAGYASRSEYVRVKLGLGEEKN